MIYVIGSGPAGVMCAAALVDQGREVTLLDVGLRLEPERQALLARMQSSDPAEWPAEAIRQVRGQAAISAGGVPLKYAHGSDYPYRDVGELIPYRNAGTAVRPTLAHGGFSSVWGAAVLPYVAADIEDAWPITLADLEPHYRAVIAKLHLSAQRDGLESMFPLYCESPDLLSPSAQARRLAERMERHRDALDEGGVSFGYSRLAVRAGSSSSGPGCVYCGLCLHGCPHELIYNSGSTLEQLRSSGRLHYRPDTLVTRLQERGDRVLIDVESTSDATTERLRGERVFVAAGTLTTTRILLESLEAYDHTLTLLDSQYYLLPLIRRQATRSVDQEPLHTLAQLFLEIRDPQISERLVHLQIYGYNQLYRDAIRSMLGPFAVFAGLPSRVLISRLLLVQGYLHSDDSSTIRATLLREGSRGCLRLESEPSTEVARKVRRVVSKLWGVRGALDALPAAPLLKIAPPGRGFHVGGGIPMREQPSRFECDVLGRPYGFNRVHLVDATVFPSVPATTITLSVMANAHRIASATGAC